MSTTSAIFDARWKSRNHVGEAAPEQRVYIRMGRMRRAYRPNAPLIPNVYIPGEDPDAPWAADWQGYEVDQDGTGHHFEAWTEMPNVLEVSLEQGFDENGLSRSVITIENLVMAEVQASPMLGVFHAIQRGYLAPWRGYVAPGRTQEHVKTPWYSKLARNAEIRVDQGYGDDQMVTTFKGIIDDVDLSSAPDRVVITSRDFGQTLVDSKLYGWNISRQLHGDVIFSDRYRADDVTDVGGAASASSERSGYPARNVIDDDPATVWESGARGADDLTEWVQIRLPAGRYSSFLLHALVDRMECYVGLYAKPQTSGAPPRRDGDPIPEGWVNLDGKTVPGTTNGGWRYIRKIGATELNSRTYRLNAEYTLGPDSILRLGFRNLHLLEDGNYHAAVRRFQAQRRTRKAEAKKRNWILVDDASDVVRVVLRWAGFKEWAVEDTGVRLKDRLIFNRANFYIDPISKIAELTGYQFFMGDPTGPGSIGVPTFRMNSSLRSGNAPDFTTGRPKPVVTVRDRDLLTAISVKLTDEPLAFNIRVRGAKATAAEGGKLVGGDRPRRIMFNYRPPWTGDIGASAKQQRMAGLLKHLITFNAQLKTEQECEVGAMLIALAEALKSATAIAQIPGNPRVELDDQVYLADEGTGLATRMWVASRSSTFTAGAKTTWSMSLGGSLIDTPDIVAIKDDITKARARGLEIPKVDRATVPTRGPNMDSGIGVL